MRRSKRLDNVPPYLFAEIDKAKAAIRAKGVDIIDLGIGDPDKPTPKRIVDALKKAVDDPQTHNYPPYEGTADFRRAVSGWYKKRFDVTLDPDTEVLSLIGSKEGIAHIFLAMVDPGDITLVSDPGYPVYKMGTMLAGGTPYPVPCLRENKFLPDLDAIDKSVVKKAKLLFVNYPNNPTGAVAGRDFYEKAVAFCKKNDILLCSDLAYSEVYYDGFRPMSVLEIAGAKDVAIEFHSLSKTYNMTGWRIGMAAGNKDAIKALGTIKTNVDSGIFKAIQVAGIEAFKGPQSEIDAMNKLYEERRNILVDGLNEMGCGIERPKASFYVWAPVPKGHTSKSFVKLLLEKAGVLVVPGSGYGEHGEGYFRASITTDASRIKEAIKRMKKEGISFK